MAETVEMLMSIVLLHGVNARPGVIGGKGFGVIEIQVAPPVVDS